MTLPSTPLVSADWLNDNIDHPNLLILDASIYADHSEKFIQFQDSISATLFFDLRKDFANSESAFPNTMPSTIQFEKNCQKLGIGNEAVIVIYDNRGIYTSPRAWFLFKTMGHQKVYVLNGGLPSWKKEGYKLSTLKTKADIPSDFNANLRPTNIVDFPTVENLSDNSNHCIIDARSADRFNGIEPEPRPEIKSGHIKNSFNLPYPKVLKNGFYRTKDELTVLFNAFELDNKEITFTCGSGITACIILLAAEIVNDNPKSLYDGSWTEWATKQKLFTS